MKTITEEIADLKTGMTDLKTAILASIENAKNEVLQHNQQIATLQARIDELEALEHITPEQINELEELKASQLELINLVAIKNPEDPTVG